MISYRKMILLLCKKQLKILGATLFDRLPGSGRWRTGRVVRRRLGRRLVLVGRTSGRQRTTCRSDEPEV